jgi:hypothetical protein
MIALLLYLKVPNIMAIPLGMVGDMVLAYTLVRILI